MEFVELVLQVGLMLVIQINEFSRRFFIQYRYLYI